MNSSVRREIRNYFQTNALTLEKEALDECERILGQLDTEKRKRWLGKIVEQLRNLSLSSSFIKFGPIRTVLEQLSSCSSRDESLFSVVDVFGAPKWELVGGKMREATEPLSTAGDVSAQTKALRQRFLTVQQRLLRNRVFEANELRSIEALLGCGAASREQVVVLGQLLQTGDGAYPWAIEDLTDRMFIEVAPECKFHAGLLTEGGVAVFEGTYDSGVLRVTAIGLVPSESAEATRSALGHANWFGGPGATCVRSRPALARASAANPHQQIVFLSDVTLDSPRVMAALWELWNGFSASPPAAFVLCGNFSSCGTLPNQMTVLRDSFRRLANQLAQFRTVFATTQFVFVPGPEDPLLFHVSPQPPLPSSLFELFEERGVAASFASNPARLLYANQEIVVFRRDLVHLLSRNSVQPCDQNTAEVEKPWEETVRNVLSMAHLSPLPPHVAPVLWHYDYLLSLNPLPDLLVLADRHVGYATRQSECVVANPGPFGGRQSGGSLDFHVYYPASRVVEPSSIAAANADNLEPVAPATVPAQ